MVSVNKLFKRIIITFFIILLFSIFIGPINKNPINDKWIANIALGYLENKYDEGFEVNYIKYSTSTGFMGERNIDVYVTPKNINTQHLKNVHVQYSYYVFLINRLGNLNDNYYSTFLNEQIVNDFDKVLGKYFDKDYYKVIPMTELFTLKKTFRPSDYQGLETFFNNYVILSETHDSSLEIVLYYTASNKDSVKELCEKIYNVRYELKYYFENVGARRHCTNYKNEPYTLAPILRVRLIKQNQSLRKNNGIVLYDENIADLTTLIDYVNKKNADSIKEN